MNIKLIKTNISLVFQYFKNNLIKAKYNFNKINSLLKIKEFSIELEIFKIVNNVTII